MIDLAHVDWLEVGACVVVGQAFLTVWFAVVFAKPWALEYGVGDPKEHTKAVPPWTYAAGAACVLLVSLALSGLQRALGVATVGSALLLGLEVASALVVATALPGYLFLKRYRALALAMGSQALLVLLLSVVLAVL